MRRARAYQEAAAQNAKPRRGIVSGGVLMLGRGRTDNSSSEPFHPRTLSTCCRLESRLRNLARRGGERGAMEDAQRLRHCSRLPSPTQASNCNRERPLIRVLRKTGLLEGFIHGVDAPSAFRVALAADDVSDHRENHLSLSVPYGSRARGCVDLIFNSLRAAQLMFQVRLTHNVVRAVGILDGCGAANSEFCKPAVHVRKQLFPLLWR
jgi:hypothetical protein